MTLIWKQLVGFKYRVTKSQVILEVHSSFPIQETSHELSSAGGKKHTRNTSYALSGFPAFCEKEIPWVFPDISLRKFQDSMRNTFLARCVILKKHRFNQSVNEHNLDTWHKTHILQTGENLSFLGHCHKFPEFTLIVGVFPKSPEFSLAGKLETHFPCFAWFPEWVRTLLVHTPVKYSGCINWSSIQLWFSLIDPPSVRPNFTSPPMLNMKLFIA